MEKKDQKIKRVLISVSDKTGIIELAGVLRKFEIEILSTGNTAELLKENGISVTRVSDYTKSPEILDGRVKTLHPFIFGAILARGDNPRDELVLKELGIKPLDLVIVNLYPFEKVKEKKGVSFEEIIENIDIGGCSLIRAAAKNFRRVGVITDPGQYQELIRELDENRGALSAEFLYRLAGAAFKMTTRYDYLISKYLSNRKQKTETTGQKTPEAQVEAIPEEITLRLEKNQDLRYGENPHQKAAFFRLINGQSGLPGIKKLQGKELSFNNFLDMNAAWEITGEFDKPAAIVIKHTNPCGAAAADNLTQAYRQALAGDPLSAFGGIVGLNGKVDKETAQELNKTKFLEVIIAPGFSPEALAIFKEKAKRRIIEAPQMSQKAEGTNWDFRALQGGFLVQDKDRRRLKPEELNVATRRKPKKEELDSLFFAWRIVKHVKSNAIVIVQGERTVGIGAGQMSRVDAVKIAIMKLKALQIDKNQPLVLASDAFFPFRDAIDEAVEIGVKAVIQPGGSKRDEEVIRACDEHNLSMVFTGIRHFQHQ